MKAIEMYPEIIPPKSWCFRIDIRNAHQTHFRINLSNRTPLCLSQFKREKCLQIM